MRISITLILVMCKRNWFRLFGSFSKENTRKNGQEEQDYMLHVMCSDRSLNYLRVIVIETWILIIEHKV